MTAASRQSAATGGIPRPRHHRDTAPMLFTVRGDQYAGVLLEQYPGRTANAVRPGSGPLPGRLYGELAEGLVPGTHGRDAPDLGVNRGQVLAAR